MLKATPKGFKTGVERAIASVGIADTLMEAEKISEQGCKAFTGLIFHRSDIANPKAIQKKIAMMGKSLRAQQAKHPFLSFGRGKCFVGTNVISSWYNHIGFLAYRHHDCVFKRGIFEC